MSKLLLVFSKILKSYTNSRKLLIQQVSKVTNSCFTIGKQITCILSYNKLDIKN